MLKKDITESKGVQADLEQRLAQQERLMKDLYDTKLEEIDMRLQANINDKFEEIKDLFTLHFGLSRNSTLPVSQESQLVGPGNRCEVVM